MMQKIILANGCKMPDLCFGTGITQIRNQGFRGKLQLLKWRIKFVFKRSDKQISLNLNLPKMIDMVMKNGCCCFDTSRAYGASEFTLGRALKKYSREEYFLVTKLCNSDQYAGRVRAGLETSLRELDEEYVDLYLMHWPVKDLFIDSWKEMEKLYKEGKCKAIGVSNFNIHHLEELKKHAEIMPMVNEIECHPLFIQVELREYCSKNNIQVLSYTSTARMDERLRKTCLVPIAKKYNKSIAQIMLRWHQQIGCVPIFNSTNLKHINANTNIKDFSLSEEEIKNITAININSRLRYDPDNCDFQQL